MTLWMSSEVSDGNVKRRLSLRTGGSPEKKSRSGVSKTDGSKDLDGPNPDWYGSSENDDNKQARTSSWTDRDPRSSRYTTNNMDIDSVETSLSSANRLSASATSSRFPRQSSIVSSPSASVDDEGDIEHARSGRSLSGERSAGDVMANPRPLAPTWATSAPNEREGNAYSSSSSRSSNRQLPYTTQLSTSAPSRIPSPPGFNLPSGQPLVNPPLKTQAAFVGKLYAMLEDEEITRTGLIHWSADGTIFTCPNPTEFAK